MAGKYVVRTFGCQMNEHDSERLAGLLEADGMEPTTDVAEADVVVLNTCCIRENADNKLYGTLGHLKSLKDARPGMEIMVAGCLSQKDRGSIAERAPYVDVVLGTHNVHRAVELLHERRESGRPVVEILEQTVAEDHELFPSALPVVRQAGYAGWVTIQMGCDNSCAFCIVPAVRGPEISRPFGDIVAEVEGAAIDGVTEVTLLGQNVNSYGVEFGDRLAFGKLLRAAGQIEGLERIRFTSPHPAAFTDDVIDAMAETPSVMPQLHMPLQSGSDRILKAMRRSYRSARFLGILDRVRAQMPHAAISTDIIVGFPGETDEDFQQTLRVVELARFATAFTFQYSIRPGTPAATMTDQVPKAVVQDRYERLAALQERISWEENQAVIGREVELLVANGEGRKDADTHRLSGRAPDSRLVHFDVPEGSELPRPGDLVTVTVTQAAPFHLIADSVDGAPLRIRRTIAGDAWDRLEAESCGVPSHGGASGGTGSVSLGLPTLRVGSPVVSGAGTTPSYDFTDGER